MQQPLFTIQRKGSDTSRHGGRPDGQVARGDALQRDYSAWIAATAEPSALVLGEPGFVYEDLFRPEKLAELSALFFERVRSSDEAAFVRFDAYRGAVLAGAPPGPEAVSEALLALAPHVGRFVAHLFGVDEEAEVFVRGSEERSPLWHFKKEFAKKRVLKATAGQGFGAGAELAARASKLAVASVAGPGLATLAEGLLGSGSDDEELAIAERVVALVEVDEVARKAAKAGGAQWTDALHARTRPCARSDRADAEVLAARG
jgi:hypothetical protein